jgi:hypothetical protein
VKRINSGIGFFALFVGSALGQVNAHPAGGRLEALAKQSGARVIWSRETGRLTGGESRADVSAMALAGSGGAQTRGVRMDFSLPAWKRAVYIDERLLQPLRRIVDQLTSDIDRFSMRSRTGLGFIGSCEFRDNPGVYPLTVDFQYAGPDAPALRVFVPDIGPVLFPGLTPKHLSILLERAINELSAH